MRSRATGDEQERRVIKRMRDWSQDSLALCLNSWCACESSVTIQTPTEINLQREVACVSSQFGKFQSTVAWSHSLEPVVTAKLLTLLM